MKKSDWIILLRKFGLSYREIEILYVLIKRGEMSISELSRRIEIPRTTIYRDIDNLIRGKWIIKQENKNLQLADLNTQKEQLYMEYKQIKEKLDALRIIHKELKASN